MKFFSEYNVCYYISNHQNKLANKNHRLTQPLISLFFTTQFRSLLLLSLMATVKAGIPIPRNPGCPTATEGKNFLQNVKLNLSIFNPLTQNVNSRRSSDYYKRSTSPWTLQYVRVSDKISVFFTSPVHHPAS